jgi:hypothetical protein
MPTDVEASTRRRTTSRWQIAKICASTPAPRDTEDVGPLDIEVPQDRAGDAGDLDHRHWYARCARSAGAGDVEGDQPPVRQVTPQGFPHLRVSADAHQEQQWRPRAFGLDTDAVSARTEERDLR